MGSDLEMMITHISARSLLVLDHHKYSYGRTGVCAADVVCYSPINTDKKKTSSSASGGQVGMLTIFILY